MPCTKEDQPAVFRTHLNNVYHKYKNNHLLLFLIAFCVVIAILVPVLCCCVIKPLKMSAFGKGPDNYISGVYFSDWSVYQAKHYPSDLDLSRLTHVFYAFLKIDGNSGEVSLSDEWGDVQMPMGRDKGALNQLGRLKNSNRNLKVVASIGGYGFAAQFQQATSGRRKLAKFVDSAAELVKKYHFDGIDIDWEYPASDNEGKQMVELLRQLRDKLNLIHENLLLTIAAPAGEHNMTYLDIPSMDKYLSFWNVMCYDFAGSGWSDKTAYHSNLYGDTGDSDLSTDAVIEKYEAHVNSSKLVLGMPLYGRSFFQPQRRSVGSSFNKQGLELPGIVQYNQLPLSGETYDDKRVAASVYDSSKQLFITYDNPRVTKAKARYVREKGLGGGFWWDSQGESNDRSRSLITAFVDELGGSENLNGDKNWV